MDARFKAPCGLRFKINGSEGEGPEGVIEGYASTWDRDLGGDRFEPGAFKGPIAEEFPEGRVKIYRLHDTAIGLPTELREDTTGLWVSAKIEPGDSVAGDETVRLASRGVYDSFSVAYKVNPASVTYVVEGGRRTRVIGEVVSLPHIGVVDGPMNQAAAIQAVKGQMSIDVERKGLYDLSAALEHMAIVEGIRRWGTLSEEEAEMAREILEHLAAVDDAIKSKMPAPESGPIDSPALAELFRAAQEMKRAALEGGS